MPASSQQLKEDFDRDGFIAIRPFLNQLEIERVRNRMDDYVRNIAPLLPREHVFYEEKGRPETLKQLQYVSNYDPFFGRLFFSEALVGLAELLLGGPVRCEHLQWFNKPAGVGQPTPPHQDGYYWMLEPNEGVTMWLALDPVDEGNGCVRYISGSHRRGLRDHSRTKTLGFSQGIADYGDADRAAEIPMRAQPGDLLVHHGLTVHRADNNASDRPRRALGFVYYARHARVDAARLEAYQNKLAGEMKAAGKI